jgi:4-hydroxybenzoate polyprenyltransferase
LIITKIISIFKVGRISMAPLTITVPILGLVFTENFSVIEIIYLGFIGLTAHLFGFLINDVVDYTIDRNVPYRQYSPLIQGLIGRNEVLFFCVFLIIISYALYVIFLGGSALGVFFITASILLSLVYNLWSKKGNFPRLLSEISLALSIGFLFLAGSVTRQAILPTIPVLFFISLSLGLLFLNGVASGLKDIKTDLANGAKSFVITTGSYVTNENRVIISKKLWLFCLFVKLLITSSFISLSFFVPLTPFLLILVFILDAYSALHVIMLLRSRTYQGIIKSSPLLNGYYAYFALLIFSIPFLPFYFEYLYLIVIFLLIFYPFHVAIKMWRKGFTLVNRLGSV